MAGLSNSTENQQDSTSQPLDQVEDASVHSGKGSKAVIANESVLNAMQRLYEERQAKNQSFLENLKDAAAWTSGGTEGPWQALRYRGEERSKQAADLFDMQNKIAAQKAAIEDRNRFFGTPTPTTGGTPATPVAGGTPATPVAGGTPSATTQTGGLLNLVADPALKQSIGATYLQDPIKAMGQLNAYLLKRAEEPAVKKEIDYLVSLGMSPQQALPIAITKVAGAGAFTPHDVRGVQGTSQQTPLQGAGALVNKQVPSTTTTAPTVTAPAPGTNVVTKAAPTPGTNAVAKAAPAAPAPAPAPAPVSESGFAPGSKEDLEFRAAASKKRMEDTEKRYSGYAGKVEEAYSDAGERFNRYSDVLNVVSDPEMSKLFGQFNKPGIINAAVKTIGEGVNAGQFGTFKITGLEGALANAGATPKQIADLRRIEAHLHRAELEYAKTYLTGQGSVSDNERKLVRDTVGSVSQPADVIRIQAQVMSERAKFDNAMGKAYDDFKTKNGQYASFGQFMMSPEAKVLKNQHNRELANILKVNPNLLNEPYGKGTEAPTGTPMQHPKDIQNIINKHKKG